MNAHAFDNSAAVSPGEDLGSEDFFDLDFGLEDLGGEGDEIGAGFDFSIYEKTLRRKQKAKAMLGLGLIG
jgi:hypothetical protein